MRPLRPILVAVVAGLLALTASSAAAANDPPLDAWLTTKAKLAVLTNTGTAGTNVNVDTVRGVVTLHGTVATDTDKEKAGQAAKGIEGIKEVRNLLKVVPAKSADSVAANDDKVKQAVQDAMKKESSLAQSDISVQSVNDGTVLLAGKAETTLAHLKAVETARAVPGVVNVASEIESPDVAKDAEIWRQIGTDGKSAPASEPVDDKKMTETIKDAGGAVRDGAKSAGNAVVSGAKSAGGATKNALKGLSGSAKDAAITAAVKAKLLADDATPGSAINVDTEDGVVTLFGNVDTSEAKAKAEANAKSVTGVKQVRNELSIAAAERHSKN